MSPLTPEQVAHLAGIMDARYANEIAEIDAITARSRAKRRQQGLAGFPADLLDAALTEVVNEADYAIVRQDVADVRDIIAARRRMADGSYGTCIDCGDAISYARLLAYPTAKRCIDCQREHEAQRQGRVERRAV